MSATARAVTEQEVNKFTKQLIHAVLGYVTDAALLLLYTQWRTLARNADLRTLDELIANPQDALQQKSNALQQVYTTLDTTLQTVSAPTVVDAQAKAAQRAYIDMKFLTSYSVLEAYWNCVKTVVSGYVIDFGAAVQQYKTLESELTAIFGPPASGGVCTKWNRLWQLRMGPAAPIMSKPTDTVTAFMQNLDKSKPDAEQRREDATELGRIAQYCEHTQTVMMQAHQRFQHSGVNTVTQLVKQKQMRLSDDATQCLRRLGTERSRRLKAAYPVSVTITDVAFQVEALKQFETKTKQLIATIAADIESKAQIK